MATSEGIGGIEPAPLKPRLSDSSLESSSVSTPPSWESPVPTSRRRAGVQEQGEFDGNSGTGSCLKVGLEEYFDVMVVGNTGMGKSTTSDKMIIAKLVEEPEGVDDYEPKIEEKKLTINNLTFWTVGGVPADLEMNVIQYLKNLRFNGVLKNSHILINDSRKEGEINPITASCQLVSNERTKMRILDVPGFFSVQTPPEGVRPEFLLEDDIHRCTQNHLRIMREILRIQSTMRMSFRRILYFLPKRGPLDRSSMNFRQELILLARYFGRSIFKCLVLVATVEPHFSVMDDIQDKLFSNAHGEQTRKVFAEALNGILSAYLRGADLNPRGADLNPREADLNPREAVLNPPVIFLSLLDTGESIVQKVERAEVEKEFLELVFNPDVCVKCSNTIRWLGNEHVECVVPTEEPEDDIIPYDESFCHPILLPRNRRPHKTEEEGGVTYIMLSVCREGQRAADPSEEICLNCKRPPGSKGCMKIGMKYEIVMEEGESKEIEVDHTNEIEEHRVLNQSTEVAVDRGEPEEDHQEEGGPIHRQDPPVDNVGEERPPGHMDGEARQVVDQPCRLEEDAAGNETQDPLSGHSAYVSMAEDDGGNTSEMVIHRNATKPDGPNSHRPCQQSLLAQTGFADMKG